MVERTQAKDLRSAGQTTNSRTIPARGIEMPMYCCEVRWVGLSTNTLPIPNRATSPERSRTGPSPGTIDSRMYLSAYAQYLGATGLTFFDDVVISFFSPNASKEHHLPARDPKDTEKETADLLKQRCSVAQLPQRGPNHLESTPFSFSVCARHCRPVVPSGPR